MSDQRKPGTKFAPGFFLTPIVMRDGIPLLLEGDVSPDILDNLGEADVELIPSRRFPEPNEVFQPTCGTLD
jgi:hypothetical protein